MHQVAAGVPLDAIDDAHVQVDQDGEAGRELVAPQATSRRLERREYRRRGAVARRRRRRTDAPFSLLTKNVHGEGAVEVTAGQPAVRGEQHVLWCGGGQLLLFCLLYGQRPCLAYAARSKRRLVIQPVRRLSTASVVPGSMKQARRANSFAASYPNNLPLAPAYPYHSKVRSKPRAANFASEFCWPCFASSKVCVSPAYARARTRRESWTYALVKEFTPPVAAECQRRSA